LDAQDELGKGIANEFEAAGVSDMSGAVGSASAVAGAPLLLSAAGFQTMKTSTAGASGSSGCGVVLSE
jgi:hypothetical protein